MRKARLALILICAAGSLPAAPLLFLDPGHGGSDKGVIIGSTDEATLAYDLALRIQAELKGNAIEAVLSRSDQSGPGLGERAAAANQSGAKAWLGLHINAHPSPTARGARIFVPKAALPKDSQRWDKAAGARAEEAKALGLALAKALQTSESQKTGVQSLDLAPFKGLALPAVVLELGFATHAETRDRLQDPAWRAEQAAKLAKALTAWLKSAEGAKP